MIALPALGLALGFFCLWKGGDYLVDGSSTVAKRLGMSELIIGLTLVAFGTSAPELIVNLFATFAKKPDIIMGNIIGSNISNTLLIIGVAGVIYPLKFSKDAVRADLPIGICATVGLWLLMANGSLTPSSLILSQIDGAILLAGFLGFLFYLKQRAQANPVPKAEPNQSLVKASLLTATGIVLLPVGGRLVVGSAISLAALFGISEAMISLLAVAIGTSLPELVTSVIAALRKESDLAIGNILGSNIFNIGLILGTCALISPIPFNAHLNSDLMIAGLSSVMILGLVVYRKPHKIIRPYALILLAIYLTYVGFVWVRG